MDKTKVHKIEILNKEPGEISKGANTEVLLDGAPLKGIRKIKYEVDASGLGVLSIDMLADFAMIQAVGQYEQTTVPLAPKVD